MIMNELYYDQEIPDILSLIEQMNTIGRYAITNDGVVPFSKNSIKENWYKSLQNKEMQNPLINYKAYLLFEFLFIPDCIIESSHYCYKDMPIPLFCFKHGSVQLHKFWKLPINQYYNDQKGEYYEVIKHDSSHIPSNQGELEELYAFINHLRKNLELEVVNRDLQLLGISFDSLTNKIFVDDWRDHPDKDKFDKQYTAEDWINHAVL